VSAHRAHRIARRTARRLDRQLPGPDKRKARRRRRRRRILKVALVIALLGSIIAGPALIGAESEDDAAAQQQAALVASVSVSDDLPYADAINQTVVIGIDPRLVAALASVASGFDPVLGCASGAGRQGIVQLVPDVAASYGVDACSPEVAIVTGAAHLVTLHREHGDWGAALEVYGGGAVPIVPVGGSGQTFAAAVLAQWEAYKAQFSGGGGLGVPVGSGPVAPKGDTSPFTEEPGLPPVTMRMLAEIIPMFGRGYATFCFGYRDGPSDHPSGHACDFVMSSPLGTEPTAEYLAHGWALCNYLIDNADRLRVKYVIWQKRIWELGEWDDYRRYTNGNLTEDHYDHVHLSLYRS